jgi:1-acyl-sn-glycerol-3-phosphate acyltransferase
VLQAAFMVVGSIFVAVLQARGLPLSWIFFGLAVASFGAVWFVFGKWGKEGVRDFGALLFRALFRTEIRGLENLPPAGTRMLIAPNHVSLIDGPLLHAILPIDASFAVDTGIARAWWAKPFLKMIRHYTMDPTKPLAARDLIKLVAAGEPVVVFPEGRITVSGSLMKVYDGTAMIADKADAVVVPVRIEGAQRSHLSYLKNGEIKRVWFPKVTISILPPVKLPIDQTLKGKLRRNAAGAALQDVMIDAMVKNAMLDHTLFEGLVHACRDRDTGKPIIEDALGTRLTLPQTDPRRPDPGPQAGEGHGGRRECRRHAAEFGRRGRRVHGAADHRSRAGDAEFLRRPRQCAGGDEGCGGQNRVDLKGLYRKRQARQADCRDRAGSEVSLSGRCPRLHRHDRQGPRPDRGHYAARGSQRQRFRGGAVHLGFGRHAERRGAFPPQYSRQRGAGPGAG